MLLKSFTTRLSYAILAALLLTSSHARADHSAAEVNVMAAIVHKIVKFVNWPEQRFAAPDDRLRFCVVGDDGIREAFEVLSERRIHGRQLSVRTVTEPEEVAMTCDVLYLAGDEHHSDEVWLDAVAGHPVLTFAEAGHFGGDGSIVSMTVRRDKVRFSINLDANKGSQLRISAQLLQLAAQVATPGHGA
ncbi:MAG: YfiR family protein [Woeseiaceae bacterium]|nr:YfiR family protein [Woeseiaceae bacterium]